MNAIPQIEDSGPAVRLYLQVFRGPSLVFTTPLQAFFLTDLSIVMEVGIEIEGDVLLRCRHQSQTGQRVTLFKLMFNTSFVEDLILRFKKKELDCAQNDKRFPADFLIDVILQDFLEHSGEQSRQFWASLENTRSQEVKKTLLVDEGEEEEKVDHSLIQKYKHLEDLVHEENSDDFDEYFEKLESQHS